MKSRSGTAPTDRHRSKPSGIADAADCRRIVCTEHKAPVERLDYWRSSFSATVAPCTIDSKDPASFWSRLDAVTLGPVVVSAVAGAPKICRTEAQTAAAAEDGLLLDILTCGGWKCEQAGNESVIKPGEAFVFHNRRTSIQVSDVSCEYRSFKIDNRVLSSRLGDTERFAGVKLTPDIPEIRLLIAYVQALAQSGDFSDANARTLVGNHVVELVVAALSRFEGHDDHGHRNSIRAVRLASVKRLVETAYREPAFDIRRASRRLDLSERYIQKLFEEVGLTFSDYLMERRLCGTREMLLDRCNDTLKIQQIAWAVGFSDISTFNRQFLRRYGERPSDMRARRTHL